MDGEFEREQTMSKRTYNPCDDCQYSYSKNNQENEICKICEFTYFKDRKQSEWISVEERLPEESAWYLVNIINHFGLDVVTFTHYTKGFGWGVTDVTHWMPLPEAPKGGE